VDEQSHRTAGLTHDRPWRRTSIRRGLLAMVVAASLLAGCDASTPSSAPASPGASATSSAASTAEAGLKSVPRNRTLMYAHGGSDGKYADYDLWNPYAVGAYFGYGPNVIFEPLAYYSSFEDKEILWLAESYTYSSDYRELTIKTRSGINWSDGQPFSAEDVAYTISTLAELGPNVQQGANVQPYVESAVATDANTVVLKFKVPAPRFFDFMTYQYDKGMEIVPKHVFEGQEWATFKNYDLEKGWPITTGPWKVVFGDPTQKIVDRLDDWWAVKAGLAADLPKIERLVMQPFSETANTQQIITDDLDHVRLLVENVKTAVDRNPLVTTHSGREAPYGFVDWWPLSLYVNASRAPFDDPDVRWALSYFLDRQQIIDVAFSGYNQLSKLPMPPYPALQRYVDAVDDLLETYDTNRFDPERGSALLTNKGWKKDASGIWTDASGTPLKMEIIGFNFIGSLAPVVAEQLKRQGVDASFSIPPDGFDRLNKGDYDAATFGHGGSIKDPYDTLRLYQSASVAVPGISGLVNWSQWTNSDYDALVDQVYMTPMTDYDTLEKQFRQAMEIWLPELPDIQLVQYYQNDAMSTKYWTGWPSDDNNYIEEHSDAKTWMLVLNRLEPTS
jgi:peptide/nickel transport system substrate-binding protein